MLKMKIQVQIVQGPAADCAFTIEKNTSCVVGRGEEADFQIENDQLISREHFSLGFDGSAITLTDLGSTNGTFVGGHALVKGRPVYLSDGQSFIAGRVSKFVVSFVGQPSHPTPPAPAPAGGLVPGAPPPDPVPRQTNFGSSLFIEGDAPPQTPPSSPDSAGGNFSQSIVKGIGGGPGIGGDSGFGGATDQSGLLFANPSSPGGVKLGEEGFSGRPQHSGPSSPASFPEIPPDRPEFVDGDEQGFDSEGSIAAPGDIGARDEDFPPLAGAESEPKQSATGASQQTPKPVEHSSTSPFASIQGVPVSPIADRPTQPTGNPAPDLPVPSSSSAVYDGSICAPGQSNQAQTDSFFSEGSNADVGSILLPNQMPVDRPGHSRSPAPPKSTEVPPGKIGFVLRELSNGLFVHSGNDVSDLRLVLKTLQNSFESIYCVHVSRTGMVPSAVTPELDIAPQPEPGKPQAGDRVDRGDSNVEAANVQSPFENLSIEENAPVAAPHPASSAIQFGIPLFAWLPEAVRRDYPILLTQEEFTFELNDFWSADAIVCLFGSSAKQLADHCLELVRTNLRTGKQEDGVFGFCWPSVLYSTLESQGEKAINRIFEGGVAAFLVEDPQQEVAWNIFSKSNLTEFLGAAGFVPQS